MAKRKSKVQEKNSPDYFISIGIVFLGAGVVFLTTLTPLTGALAMIVGAVYLGIGIKKKNEEKSKKKK